jgi:hypothetical protein
MTLAKKIALTMALPVLLAGCAVAGDHAEDFYVAPGKYVFYDCKQLAGVAAHFEQRNKELEDLMARAKKGAGGELVSAMAYNSDYYSNLGELMDVHREQAEKKCDPNMTAAPTPPPEQKPVKRSKKR